MQIYYDHQIFSAQEFGGISRYFVEIAHGIRALQSGEVEIFAPVYINHHLHERPYLCPKSKYVRYVKNTFPIIQTLNSVASNVYFSGRRKAGIFHPTYYGPAAATPPGSKRVITVFDMIHEKLPAEFPKQDDTRRNKARAICAADHVICISEKTRTDLMELLQVPREKTSVVYLGNSLVQPASTSGNQEITRRPYVIYVGLRNGYKNFSKVMRAYAASRLPSCKVQFLCVGGGTFTKDEQQLIAALGVAALVSQTSVPDWELAELYSTATLLVYPSVYEGFGIPLVEAMSMGCPIACANASCFPEIALDAAEFFEPQDVESITHAMERIVFDSHRAADLVAKGHLRSKAFTWEGSARKTLDLYQAIF